MIMNNIDLSLVLIYTIGAFLTLDVYKIILMQYLTFNLGTLTWSTQLTKSSTVPKAVTQKNNMVYICSRTAQDQYCGFSFESLAPVLLKSDYYLFIIGQMIKLYYRWQYVWSS